MPAGGTVGRSIRTLTQAEGQGPVELQSSTITNKSAACCFPASDYRSTNMTDSKRGIVDKTRRKGDAALCHAEPTGWLPEQFNAGQKCAGAGAHLYRTCLTQRLTGHELTQMDAFVNRSVFFEIPGY